MLYFYNNKFDLRKPFSFTRSIQDHPPTSSSNVNISVTKSYKKHGIFIFFILCLYKD